MASFNRVLLMGNLTRDVELSFTPSGMAIAKMGLAVNRKWRDQQSGEMREEVTFVDIDVFGKSAELCAQYLMKGRPVFVEGRLKLDQWDDKQTGQKRSKLKVVADRVQFLGGGQQQQQGQGVAPAAARPAAQRPANTAQRPATRAAQNPAAQPPGDDFDFAIDESQAPF